MLYAHFNEKNKTFFHFLLNIISQSLYLHKVVLSYLKSLWHTKKPLVRLKI
nr:MAG TPA: hypothetical protein [Caudoviricetes sp.]